MSFIPKSNSSKTLVSILIVVSIVLLRFAWGNFDWTYFIVLGDNFVSEQIIGEEVIIQKGPGYDGQFYYALAKDPFSFEKVKGGIIVDHPPYRHQRILYPLLAHIAAFGIPSFIPFMLVLINMISLIIISFTVSNFKFIASIKWSFYLPFLISGLWMSLSRDLTECIEVLLLVLALKSLFEKRLYLFIFLSSLALLTRETTIIFIGAMTAIWFWRDMSSPQLLRYKIQNSLLLTVPFLLLSFWKLILLHSYPSSELVSASSNITFPFNGLYMSFMTNLKSIESPKSYIEFLVWIAFLIWQFCIFGLGINAMTFKFKSQFVGSTLSVLGVIGMSFASVFSISIYIDDWAFLRILSSLDLFLFLLILNQKKALPNWFSIATILLALLTIARIIFRV